MRQKPIARWSICFFLCLVQIGKADSIRVTPAGERPDDVRHQAQKNLNGFFPFNVPASLEAWQFRRKQLQTRILVATGLWPMPPKTPLNPVIHGKSKRDGFTVEKVYFESYPGHFVTGLLFRPEGNQANRPAVLCPHGHGGRLQDHGPAKIRQLIVEGQERFEGSGRFPKLARCAQLARMGCVTFIFDMLGYADSRQISMGVAHRLMEPRDHLENAERWGLFTTQAELRMQSGFGIQAWNSIRALDFLCGLPDVDESRVAVTGGSGGGTQTLITCALDDRPVASFPQGMVSTAMQGGCLCENASLLRIGTGNVEFAAMMAPKPTAMTAANDWTIDMMTKGYPDLQKLYGMYGVKENVKCASMIHFPHNYNYVTRAMMYDWFNTHLQLGLDSPIVEEDFLPLTPEEYTVWNDEHPLPPDGEEHEVALLQWITANTREQLDAVSPQNTGSLDALRHVIGTALKTIVGRDLPDGTKIVREKSSKRQAEGYLEIGDLIRFGGEAIPVVWLYPTEKEWRGDVVIWTTGIGKDGLFDGGRRPRPEVQSLISKGYTVLAPDLFLQGEHVVDGNRAKAAPTVKGARASAVYTYAYNDSLAVQRVHDIMTLVALVRADSRTRNVHLVAIEDAAPFGCLASSILGDSIGKRIIDTQGFRFVDIRSYANVDFVPGAVKYGDVDTMLALSAPQPLFIAGEDGQPSQLQKAAYSVTNSSDRLHSIKGGVSELISAAFE